MFKFFILLFINFHIFANCIKLKNVDLLHNKHNVEMDFSIYNNKCIDKKLINNILKQVDNNLTKAGYITSKAFLPQQNIKNGNLIVDIFLGKINQITDGRPADNHNITTAFLGQSGASLNLRDLENALESINKVPSVKASFKIKPSAKILGSDVLVDIQQSFPLRLIIGRNFNDKLTGDNSDLALDFSWDNFLNINDILSYNQNNSKEQSFYQSSKSSSLSYSFPLASYYVSFDKSRAKYRRGVDGINAKYLANGTTKSYGIGLNKVLSRNKNNKYQLFTKLTYKDNNNYFANELIGVSSYKTSQLQLKFSHTYLKSWGSLISFFSAYKGLDWFGARDDNYISNEIDNKSQAKLEFSKYIVGSNITVKLPYTSVFTSAFNLQYSKDVLYDHDKLVIGSTNTVRGYNAINLAVDSGFYIKNTISKNIYINSGDIILNSIDIGLGFDYGRQIGGNTIRGIGINIKINGSTSNMVFNWGRALKVLSHNQNKNTFSANVNFKF